MAFLYTSPNSGSEEGILSFIRQLLVDSNMYYDEDDPKVDISGADSNIFELILEG